MYKVLIVEDENIILKGLLYSINWTELDCVIIGHAKNGSLGLEMIDNLSPDIVLTDISMPIMDGLEMIEKASKNKIFSSIIITGYDEFELAKTAISLGVVDYLLKPLDLDDLTKAIGKCKIQLKQMQLYLTKKDIEDTIIPKLEISSRFIKNVINYIELNYMKNFGIQDIADELKLSYSTVRKKFKEETNINLNDFISRYRIRKSIEIMKNSDKTIYMIAEDVGFSDYKYFIKVFSKYTETTPLQFMQHINN